MTFFKSKTQGAAFNGTSRDYITRDSVERVNQRMMVSDRIHGNIDSVFEKFEISRPTREQLESAASRAMRSLLNAK